MILHVRRSSASPSPQEARQSRRIFIVEDSGPHGGKARGGGCHYRKTWRIRLQPLRLECVYTSPTATTEDAPDAC